MERREWGKEMTTETSNARGEWIREWQGSGPQRGFHIREATRLHNNRVVAYLGDQVDGEQVDKLIAEHNGCHANGDPIHDAPSAREWCEQNSVATTTEWRAGWDACRVEFPRIAAAPPPAAARGDVRGLVSALQSMRDRMMAALPPKFGDAFDGDFDTLLEAINAFKAGLGQNLAALAQPPAAVDEADR